MIPTESGIMRSAYKDKPNYWAYQPGWYGIPGAQGRYSTKVHLVFQGKPVCGCKLSPKQEFQWCAQGIVFSLLECVHCRKIAAKLLKRIQNQNLRKTN